MGLLGAMGKGIRVCHALKILCLSYQCLLGMVSRPYRRYVPQMAGDCDVAKSGDDGVAEERLGEH